MSRTRELEAMIQTMIERDLEKVGVVDGRMIASNLSATLPEPFLVEVARENLRSMVSDAVRRRIARTRSGLVTPAMPVRARSRADRALNRSEKTWSEFLEYNGTYHVPYMKMKRQDLLQAADIRRQRGEREIHLAALHEAVASKLPNDTTEVHEVLTPEDVERINAGIIVKYSMTWDDFLDGLQRLVPSPFAAD